MRDNGLSVKDEQIAMSIWRSGYIHDKNKVRQMAREKMRSLIAYDYSANLPANKRDKFLEACRLNEWS